MSALGDIRVLDFGRYVAGPYCATLLGYLGAEVIRVERLGGGEDRAIAPVTEQGEGAVFLQTGCNKRSLALNLGSDQGRKIVEQLLQRSDVVVANLPPATLRKLGLDLASLHAVNPRLVLANVTAFGTEGPWALRGGFDGIGQAMSGAAYITGTPGAPAKAAAPYVDYCSAVLATVGVLAALRERDAAGSEGQGQSVEGSLLGTALAVFNSHLIEQGVLGLDREGTGNRVQTSAPSDVFATRDGHVLVHCPGNAVFARWARLLGLEEWINDPRFATDQGRGDHRNEICAPMADWCAEQTTDQVLATLAENGIPAGPILTPREALAHPQTRAVNVLREVDYPGLPQPAPVAGLPFTLSAGGEDIRSRPPQCGEHSAEILAELGYSPNQIEALRKQGIIAQAAPDKGFAQRR